MPQDTRNGYANATIEEVWKPLADPTRFPEWWEGVQIVHNHGGGSFSQELAHIPGKALQQQLEVNLSEGSVTISCRVSGMKFHWQLDEDSPGTRIEVHVEVPESKADLLDGEMDIIEKSLARLVKLAEGAAMR